MVQMKDLWYVKARNIETGEEIQRIAASNDGVLDAESQMRSYLVESGRVTTDLAQWEIIEARRASA